MEGKEKPAMQRRLRAIAVLVLSAAIGAACSTMKPPTLAVDGLKM